MTVRSDFILDCLKLPKERAYNIANGTRPYTNPVVPYRRIPIRKIWGIVN